MRDASGASFYPAKTFGKGFEEVTRVTTGGPDVNTQRTAEDTDRARNTHGLWTNDVNRVCDDLRKPQASNTLSETQGVSDTRALGRTGWANPISVSPHEGAPVVPCGHHTPLT